MKVKGEATPAPRPERPPGGYTILVVDDEEAVRRLASRMITWMGNQALEARLMAAKRSRPLKNTTVPSTSSSPT